MARWFLENPGGPQPLSLPSAWRISSLVQSSRGWDITSGPFPREYSTSSSFFRPCLLGTFQRWLFLQARRGGPLTHRLRDALDPLIFLNILKKIFYVSQHFTCPRDPG